MPKVTFLPDGKSVEVPKGTNLLDAAELAGARMGHACGGVCGCSTCHCWVRQGLPSLSEADDRELDRLDLAFEVKPVSRLGCQAEVGEADVVVELTQESLRSWYDENPDERRAAEARGEKLP